MYLILRVRPDVADVWRKGTAPWSQLSRMTLTALRICVRQHSKQDCPPIFHTTLPFPSTSEFLGTSTLHTFHLSRLEHVSQDYSHEVEQL